ncbi:hypothetical protein BGY98DRAFT_1182423 [Russula aff. rugulosa BPL654]|nr:hypothetical protein BGY98DRAFT_1182423 [Russula aff. rugulosa BPL654]
MSRKRDMRGRRMKFPRTGAGHPLSATYLHKILELFLTYYVQSTMRMEWWKMVVEKLCICIPSPRSASELFMTDELPTDPAMRFTDLFLNRELWKAEHIEPYLSDIAVDTKSLTSSY